MGGNSKDEQFQDLMFRKLVDALTNQAKDLVRDINKTMREIDGQAPEPSVDSMQVQNFYSEMEAKIASHPHFASCSKEEIDEYVEGIERYLTHKMYKRFFLVSQEDIERDVELSKRFRALDFVKLEHLEVSPGLVSDASLIHAINSLKPMDDCRSPRQKLVCILKCCHYINNILMSNAGGDFGADDFTPILIYVVIRAQPERLISNLAFIERFRNQSRLIGEAQYYFTQLYGAATFIETMDASSLKVNPDEFIAHMLNHGIVSEEQLQSGSPLRRISRNQPGSPFARTTSSLARESAAAATAEAGSSGDASRPQLEATPGPTVQPPPLPPPPKSTSELQAEGLPLILQAEAAGQLRARHRYLYSSAEDLTVRDVHQLLTDYKELALQYEALSLAINKQREVHRTAMVAAQARQTPALTPPPKAAAPPPPPSTSQPSASAVASAPPSSSNLINLDDTPTRPPPSQQPPSTPQPAASQAAPTETPQAPFLSTPSSAAAPGDLICLTPSNDAPSTPMRSAPPSIDVPDSSNSISDTLAALTPTPTKELKQPSSTQKAKSIDQEPTTSSDHQQTTANAAEKPVAAPLAPLPSLDHLLQQDATAASASASRATASDKQETSLI